MCLMDMDMDMDMDRASAGADCARSLVLKVVEEHEPALRRFVQSQTRDVLEIDDVMQDLYIRVLQNDEAIRRSESQRAYLFSMARNLVRDRGRHRVARARAMADFQAVVEVGTQSAHRYSAPDQEHGVRARQGGDAVKKAMRCLKDEHREIFYLSRMEGLRNNEIADRLGVSLRSVERHVSEVSSYMRETLAAYI
jgi:RNA polymerase sigma-70 factor (ECF subfamily)